MLNKMELADTLSKITPYTGLQLQPLTQFKWLIVTTYFRKNGL